VIAVESSRPENRGVVNLTQEEPAIALNRYRGNPHLERVVLRWEVSFHYNRRAREN